MKTILKLVVPALLSLAVAQAQPRITSILNNASYIVPPLPGSGIAQGSIFAIFGENMGPAALVQASFPLPTELSGTRLVISASGADVNAFLVYTLAGQLAAVLPSNTPVGPAVARVTYNGQTSAPFSFTVVRSSPGLFTLNGGGTGPAVLTTPDFKVITYTNAAMQGDVLSAWATGITGLTGRSDNTAAEFFDPTITVEVFVGGKLANIRYRGRAPGLSGLDQIVFDLPAGVQPGCTVSLAIRVGGVISNYSSLAVGGSNRSCSDPNGFSEADTNKALTSGLRIGAISLARIRTKATVPGAGTIETRVDAGSGSFWTVDANGFVRSQGLGTPSVGNCQVVTYGGETAPVDPLASNALNAGAQLTVTGPNGSKQIPRIAGGGYAASLGMGTVIPGFPTPGSTLFLDPGDYTVTGPGGPDVGSFTARLTVPQPLTTNIDSITTISRGAPLSITWTGGGANEYVFVSGSSSRQNPTVSASFFCIERASAGRIVVPSEVLLAMPPSQSIQGAPLGFLSIGSAPFTDVGRFTAQGLDLGVVSYSSADGKNLSYE